MNPTNTLKTSAHSVDVLYSNPDHNLSTLTIPSSEGCISKWFKKNGNSVSKDEILCIVETDLFSYEIKSPDTGILAIFKDTYDTIPSGSVIGSIDILDQLPKKSNPSPLPNSYIAPLLDEYTNLEDELSDLFEEKPSIEMLSDNDKMLIFSFWMHTNHTESLFKSFSDLRYDWELEKRFSNPFLIFSSILLLSGIFFSNPILFFVSIALIFCKPAVKNFSKNFFSKNKFEEKRLQEYQDDILKARLNNFNNTYFESSIIPQVKNSVGYQIERKNGFPSDKNSRTSVNNESFFKKALNTIFVFSGWFTVFIVYQVITASPYSYLVNPKELWKYLYLIPLALFLWFALPFFYFFLLVYLKGKILAFFNKKRNET